MVINWQRGLGVFLITVVLSFIVMLLTNSFVATIPLLALGFPISALSLISKERYKKFLYLVCALYAIEAVIWIIAYATQSVEWTSPTLMIPFGVFVTVVVSNFIAGMPLAWVYGAVLYPLLMLVSESRLEQINTESVVNITFVTGPVTIALLILGWQALPKNKK